MKKQLLAVVCALLVPGISAAQDKPRIAVLSFEFATVKSDADAVFGGSADVGQGIAELMMDNLVKSGRADVYERGRLESVIKEQDRNNSSRFDPSTAAAIGRAVGVQAIIMGSITRLGQQEKKLIAMKRTETLISISARVVEASTAKILMTVTGEGVEKRNGVVVESLPFGKDLPGNLLATSMAANWVGSKFRESLIGKAMATAAQQAAAQIVEQIGKLPVGVAAGTTLAAAPGAAAETAPAAASAPPATPAPAAPNANLAAPFTAAVMIDMVKSGVPEAQIIEIVRNHKNLAISALDPQWAIAVTMNKLSIPIQNAVRERGSLPALEPEPNRPAARSGASPRGGTPTSGSGASK